MLDKQELIDQIEAVSQSTNLNQAIIEKDLFATYAILAISQFRDEVFRFVFHGGTSLAKAHSIVNRMSENCDFKILFIDPRIKMPAAAKRKALRQMRRRLVEFLRSYDFIIDDKNIRVRNESQFINIKMDYQAYYPPTPGIKPYIELEFFLSETKIEPSLKSVTTLIEKILGPKIQHVQCTIPSVAIMETAAEKWVALTRRVAISKNNSRFRDPNLVRHLYDLYQINTNGHLDHEFKTLRDQILDEELLRFKNKEDEYYLNPKQATTQAIEELQQSTYWYDNWNRFLNTMVFTQEKISYQEAVDNLKFISL